MRAKITHAPIVYKPDTPKKIVQRKMISKHSELEIYSKFKPNNQRRNKIRTENQGNHPISKQPVVQQQENQPITTKRAKNK